MWVKEEVSQARIRALRDRGFRLTVVKLDDTKLPDYLSTRSYIDIDKGIDVVIENLKETAKDLTPPEILVGTVELKDAFQNREAEMDALERYTFTKDCGGILITGLQGMGKTTLVKRGMAKLFSNLMPCWINLDTCLTPLRFISAIARPLSLVIEPDKVASGPMEIWKDKILPEIIASQKLFVVLDNFDISERMVHSKQMCDLLDCVVSDLVKINKLDNPGLIIIGSLKPELRQKVLERLEIIKVRALTHKDMLRALRYQIQRVAVNVEPSSKDLNELAEALKGYPLALRLAAEQIAVEGFERILETVGGLNELLTRLAQDLMAGIRLDKKERDVLILLSVAKKQLYLELAEDLLGSDVAILNDLTTKQVLDSAGRAYFVHEVLRDYVLESMADPIEIRDAHSKLFDLYNKNWKKAPLLSAASAELASMAYFHAITAGREGEADFVKTAYQEETREAAIELYRRGDYKTALTYLEHLREMNKDLEPILKYYYALSLNRKGRREEALRTIDELIDANQSTSRYHHSKGVILRSLNRDKEALVSFRRAVTTSTSRRKSIVALSSLAGQLCNMGMTKEGLDYAKEAFAIDPSDSQVISVLVSIYHSLGDDKKGLEILEDALKRRQTDTRLHARAGYIAKDMGNLIKAKEHLSRASQDPAQADVITALADVYIGLKNYELAENILEKYPDRRTRDGSYWTTKANILRHKANFPEAIKSIKMALKQEPNNPVHYGGACQLYIDISKIAIKEGESEKARLNIEYAREYLNRGLTLDFENEILLTIKRDLERLDSSLF